MITTSFQNDTWTEAESAGIRDRFRKLTRSLSIAGRQKPRVVALPGGKLRVVESLAESDQSFDSEPELDEVDGESDPLFECIFIAGIYNDMETNRFVPFTRNQFPEDVSQHFFEKFLLLNNAKVTLPDYKILVL